MTDFLLTNPETEESVGDFAIQVGNASTPGASTQSAVAHGSDIVSRGNTPLSPRSDKRRSIEVFANDHQGQTGLSQVDTTDAECLKRNFEALCQETFGNLPSCGSVSTAPSRPNSKDPFVPSLPNLSIASMEVPFFVRRAEDAFQRGNAHQSRDVHPQSQTSGYGERTESQRAGHLEGIQARFPSKTNATSVIQSEGSSRYQNNEASRLAEQPTTCSSILPEADSFCEVDIKQEFPTPDIPVSQTHPINVLSLNPDAVQHRGDSVYTPISSLKVEQSEPIRSECKLEAGSSDFTGTPDSTSATSSTNSKVPLIPGCGKYSLKGIYVTRQDTVPSRSLLKKHNPSSGTQRKRASPKSVRVPVTQIHSPNVLCQDTGTVLQVDDIQPPMEPSDNTQREIHRTECSLPVFPGQPMRTRTGAEVRIIAGYGKYAEGGPDPRSYLPTRDGLTPRIQESRPPRVPVIQSRIIRPAQPSPSKSKLNDPKKVQNELVIYKCYICRVRFRGSDGLQKHKAAFHPKSCPKE